MRTNEIAMPLYNDITKPAPPLPSSELVLCWPGVSLLPPLTRRGFGPGLVILVPTHNDQTTVSINAERVPSLCVKWAEEGYAVVEIQHSAMASGISSALQSAIEALSRCDKCEPKDKIGVVVYEPELWNEISEALVLIPKAVAAAVYGSVSDESTLVSPRIPTVFHLAGRAADIPKHSQNLTVYYYPNAKSHRFAIPLQAEFNYSTEALSHTRNLQLLKKNMGGPFFDLEHIWDEHTHYEFADRSVQHTMSTMVQEPYVNHVPVLTGGVGRNSLSQFYRNNFIFSNSGDTELELVSRSVAIDRVIDEFIFKFTHEKEIDWLVPGIPPTGRKVEVPFIAVVNIRGDRLYHEHIWWDQGTVLRQLGLLPEYLPYPYPLPGEQEPADGKHFEYRVPVAGIESARKLSDRNSVPSNEMFLFKIREV